MKRAAVVVVAAAILIAVTLAAAHHNPDPLPPEARADRIVVEKSRRRLTLYRGGVPLKTYRISLGSHPVGPKEVERDGRTPEGTYVIDGRVGRSCCHRALHISYPTPQQAAAARQRGASPGGAIMVHGLVHGFGWVGALHRTRDWTQGCIAVTNEEMDEIWRAVPAGTPIEVRP